MKKDLNKILIESMLKNAVKDIHSSPGRTVRNLVDLAVNFTRGRFQKRFLSCIQQMLQNEDSAYYQLLIDMVSNVDMDLLINFGMNLGYNGCTKGASLIRKIEEEKGFNVPWSLTLQVNSQKLESEPDVYPDILEQGVSLGIYTYLLFFPSGDAEKLIPLFEGQPDCAFVIFLKGHQITETFLEHVKNSKNVMISVYNNEEMLEACVKLQKNRMLYGVHQRYTEDSLSEVLSEKWILEVLDHHPQAVMLIPEPTCPEETRKAAHSHILSAREGQKYPVLFLDVVGDAWMIDNIISEDAYVVGFAKDGSMSTYDGQRVDVDFNIFRSSLENILRNTIKK